MLSLRAKITRKVVGRFFKTDPIKDENFIEKMKNQSVKLPFKTPSGYELEKFELDSLPVEIFKKKDNKEKKAVYLLHGGAYILGLSNVYRNVAYKFSKATNGADVIMIDYRLAPEHTFPAALEDAMKGWEWMLENGYKEEDILVVGDSAGGNLTFALLQKLKQLKKKLPCAVVGISPWTDMTASGKSYFEKYNRDVMFGSKNEVNEDMAKEMFGSPIYSYCGEHYRKDPLLSPIFGDYKDFPPTIITVGEDEILLDDSLTVAEKIKAAGGEVEVHIREGMFHVYPLMYKLFPEAKKDMQKILLFMQKHLAR